MNAKHPSFRLLTIAWLLLIALTLGTIFTGRVGELEPIGLTWTAALLIVTGFKAITILRWFLNLRAASAGWNTLFISYLVILLLIIFGTATIN